MCRYNVQPNMFVLSKDVTSCFCYFNFMNSRFQLVEDKILFREVQIVHEVECLKIN
jgi:hypothetical protein